jgi:2'-hydroxyisoflavone reductase
MTNRRSFIKQAGLTSVAAAALPISSLLAASSPKLKILILGGTGFLGPHTVNAALARGHEITLFNRGKSDPDLFPELETITGDRLSDDINQLANRHWDWVIDTSAYFPRAVNRALQVLKNNIGQYMLVSTISVYADFSQPNMDETAAVGMLDNPHTEEITGNTYGPLKALCEQAAEEQLPGRVCTIRPGLIVGPRDKTDRFTYWPVRFKRGGQVLAPGDGQDYIQFIDVRDLAEWMIHCAENQVNGIFNAQTNGRDFTMSKLLNSCVETLNPDAQLNWVDSDFLEQHQVAPWRDMPVWIPAKGEYAGSGTMSAKKAHANGLKERPLKQIIADCYQWFSRLPTERQTQLRAGLAVDKETQVLAAWIKTQTLKTENK